MKKKLKKLICCVMTVAMILSVFTSYSFPVFAEPAEDVETVSAPDGTEQVEEDAETETEDSSVEDFVDDSEDAETVEDAEVGDNAGDAEEAEGGEDTADSEDEPLLAEPDQGENIEIAKAFPDENFRSYVLAEFDDNEDGWLSPAEIEQVTAIWCYDSAINSLQGIEVFYNLSTLSCSWNNLSELDVSQNTQLQELICYGNNITSLNIGNNQLLLERLKSCIRKENQPIYDGHEAGDRRCTRYSIRGGIVVITDAGVTITPTFEEIMDSATKHVVSFESEISTAFSTVDKGNPIRRWKPNPVKRGYKFDGWYIDEECTTLYDFSTPVTTNFVLYGKFEPGDIAIYQVYYNDGDTTLRSIEVEEGDSVMSFTPTKEGVEFVGWYKDKDFSEAFDFDSAITGDTTIYAKWSNDVSKYTVTFMDGTTTYKTIKVSEGQAVSKPTDPTKEGSEFVGWYTDEALSKAYDFSTVVKANTVLYAKWKVQTVFDVTKYGAKPNDNKDDWSAINSVLSKASTIDDTIEVRFPAGTYNISGSLYVKSNTHIILDKNAIIKSTSTSDLVGMIDGDPADKTKGGYDQLENIEIEGGTWDRNAQASQLAGAFIFWHGKNISIHDLTIKNCTDHVINVSANKDVTIKNVTFQNHIAYTGSSSEFWGDHSVGDITRYEFVEVIHTDFAGSGEKGATPLDGTVCKNVTISNCTFESTLAGVGTHHNGNKAENITVTNCTFNNLRYGAALNAWSFGSFVFTKNYVTGTKSGVILNASTGTVSGNAIAVSGTRSDASVDDIVIKLTNSSNGTIENNSVSIAQKIGKGIVVEGGTAKIQGNTITNANKHGIYIAGAGGFSVLKNTISKAKECSIFITGCSGENKVDSNIIKEADQSSAWAGIFVKSSTGNTTVSQNKVECSHTDAAIYFEKSSGTITSNILNSPGPRGIKLKGSDATANGNTISYAKSSGIYSEEGGNVRLIGNTISNSKDDGIRLFGNTGVYVDGNTIQNSGRYGMYINKATQGITVINNKISGSSEYYGIFIEENAGKTDFAENFYERNGNSYTGYNYLASNKVTCGSLAGIYANKCSAVILGNSVTECSGDALQTLGTSGQTVSFEIKYNTLITSSGSNYDIRLNSYSKGVWVIDNTLGNRGLNAAGGVTYYTKSDIGSADVSAIPTQVYTGKPVTPSLTVTKAGKTLKVNTDYTVSFTNNTNCGLATAKITGKGNYVGTKTLTFYIYKSNSVVFIFNDIKPGAWYVDSVQYAYDTGMMAGKGAGFGPSNNITRNEVTQILYNIEGKPAVSTENPFPDLEKGHWSYNSVLWAYENEIVKGRGDGTFGVGKNISRLDLAIILYKYAGIKNYDLTKKDSAINSFTDASKLPYGRDAMNWAVTQGIISGKQNADGSYRLDYAGKATRAECAGMMKKLIEKNTKK